MPAACLLVLGLPYISLKILNFDIDLFHLAFLTAGVTFLWVYKKRTSLQLRYALSSGWALGTILALFIGIGLLSYTLASKSNPIDLEFNSSIMIILWRGVVFGIVGAALISAFPFVTVWRAFAGANPGNIRKIGVFITAVIAISLTSLSYNIGLSGFNKDRISYNVKMSILTGIPTLLSGNPIASPVAGAFLYSGESMFFENESDASAGVKLAAKKPEGLN
ncbi:MAG: hypothetical protein JSU85_08255 [Candidatus Zixiibacteriota bacterium]|nr:MAG: hypothetical protein JSU85_08255 [candidate division Zixibacteria bacterium]